MPIATEKRSRLQKALVSCFDPRSLLQFAQMHLVFDDINFVKVVNFNRSTEEISFDLLDKVDQRGHLEELLMALYQERGNNTEVGAFRANFDIAPATATTTAGAIPESVRRGVIDFQARFNERQKQFGYLNAYKQLHDLLHDLTVYRADLESMVLKIQRGGDEPLDPEEITDRLSLMLGEGEASLKGTENQTRHRRWFDKFRQSVADLSGEVVKSDPASIDAAKLDRAMEVLAHLPAKEQSNLNELLFDCATRLDSDDLVTRIDGILAALGKANASGPEADNLRIGVGPFRASCSGLTLLIQEHDLCQQVDGALREAEGLPEISPDTLSRWSDIKVWLQELARRHPDEIASTRPAESVSRFEEAALAGDKKKVILHFNRLKERFDLLFFRTDKALLNTTRDLLVAAKVLDATLKRF